MRRVARSGFSEADQRHEAYDLVGHALSSAIAATGFGEAHSSEAVRHRIREMIDAESAEAVLSDDTIVQRLREAGIDIARRTVAKYREAMRIPSSVQRRREKQNAGPAI